MTVSTLQSIQRALRHLQEIKKGDNEEVNLLITVAEDSLRRVEQLLKKQLANEGVEVIL